jgi:DNA repair exonuclease SbcCD ATPase subunit
MRVRGMRLEGFMSHRLTTVKFPERGLVVVQGPNGAGKSSLVEAVAFARSGKTLRGTPPWSGDSGDVTVACDGLRIERTRTKGKGHLYWTPVDDGSEAGNALDAVYRLGGVAPVNTDNGQFKWESNTHAQEGLEKVIGGYDVWRRSCVFSSSDAAHFTLATDGERKRLLETVLGLDRFDVALEACRADLSGVRKAIQGVEMDAAKATSAVEFAEGNIPNLERAAQEAEAAVPPDVDVPPAADVTKLQEALRGREAWMAERSRRVDRDNRAVATAEAELRRRTAELARLSVGACSACGQAIPHDLVAHQQEGVKAAEEAAGKVKAAAEATRAALDDEAAEAQEDIGILRQKLSDLTERRRAGERNRATRLAAEAALKSARDRLASARADLGRLRAEAEEARGRVAAAGADLGVLEAVEAVLGLRGVRAHVLGESLSGISAVANSWLPRLGRADLAVELKPYSEKKTGGVTDAISIEVTGAGNGYGYRGCSAGERRRVDVALLLGMGEVATAALGMGGGATLFFDELFDGLDADGVQAAAQALADLARDRCVVVITHNDDLAAQVAADLRLRVEGGEIK